ncbi:aminodeoxychorismate synthase component I [Chitiniphilus eburneus]|uniref:aminodeoxychorismate synthase component I n=1 Tax=Chitiniphilus eburneus TaxID=2571148 RepID=UPI00145F381E|nr:aminodeoxychorismate synthase component I [Chitiniphilus eburneus]
MSLFQIEVRTLDCCPDPLQVFKQEFLHAPSKFFLESSVVRPGFSRFSFMGDAAGRFGETIAYSIDDGLAVIEHGGERAVVHTPSVFELLKARLQQFRTELPADLPFAFNLGYVGLLGYELKGETIGNKAHRADTPDAVFLFATRLIAFDHAEQRCHLLHLIADEADRADAHGWFDDVAARLGMAGAAAPATPQGSRMTLPDVERWIADHAAIRHPKPAYLDKIQQALGEIVNGESYEVCLTNIIEFPFAESSFDLYCVMRQLTPAPHAGYFNVGDFHLVSSSPERFLSVDAQGQAEAKPIKGTRPRGRTPDEDRQQMDNLLGDEKDRAENLMIVDLLRNDLGQVCNLRSVHVPRLFDVESYSHVHQLVSTIRGQLKPGVSTVDCVRAVFPGGSMTGAPKKRTMEIIDRLEQGPRGSYSGALGWFGLCGACDFNIVIRSVTVDKGHARFGVGGAITALSDPESEFAETMVKARGVVEAVERLREVRA